MLKSWMIMKGIPLKDEGIAERMEMPLEEFRAKAYAKRKRDMFSPGEFEKFAEVLWHYGSSLVDVALQELKDIKGGYQHFNTNLSKNRRTLK